MSLKLINAKNLTKSFDDFIAVNNIDLDVNRGEVVGFLGPNGAGKSTTMKMLTGFLEPDSGSIEICNVDLKKIHFKLKGLLVICQKVHLLIQIWKFATFYLLLVK